MKRMNFQDYFNDNAMDVSVRGEHRYVSFSSEDADSGELVQINLSCENVEKLIKHLCTAIK